MTAATSGLPEAVAGIRALARPLRTADDFDPLLDRIADARIVLIGEASHGTAEYYRWRAELSRRLIAEHGFSFVAVEGDWPDCFRIHRWAADRAEPDRTARDVLGEFDCWPRWMWANEEVADFVGWLREHNAATGAGVGFYGLDVYSLWESMGIVVGYVMDRYPDLLRNAQRAWTCFEPYNGDPNAYAYATRMVPTTCEDEVVALLTGIRRAADAEGADPRDPEAALDARQNAEVMAGAARYYRAMLRADSESWNIRDHHMADTLDRLLAHRGPSAKAIVWEHNTHVGDARATPMADRGMVNVGQLVRERHGDAAVVAVGMAGHRGTVMAADSWGATPRVLPVPDAPEGSHEQLLHDALGEPSLAVFPPAGDSPWLTRPRGHRAIGVVYRPQHERFGNWVPTVMGRRYDALCYFDTTEAVHPLAVDEPPQPGAEQETYPSGQ
ncbi:erythromycin esterase family protein [Catenulispora subtropica]|uniref:Erythromycin esterase n=1 Tax=Catenulispora subtropica TaxID=450798 RepID=A0ABN2SIB7_9ACTN